MTTEEPFGPEPALEPELEPTPEPDPGTSSAPPPRRRVDPWTLVLGILGGALLGTGVTFAVLGFTGTLDEPPPPTTLPPPPSVTAPPPTTAPLPVAERASAAAIAQRAVPSIVAVEMGEAPVESGGSGVVYGSDGYVITNHHVIEGGGTVMVVFADGARYPAQIVGSDPVTDIGVLRVERPDLTPLDIGDPTALEVGQMAVAIGNPLALTGGPSVTEGSSAPAIAGSKSKRAESSTGSSRPTPRSHMALPAGRCSMRAPDSSGSQRPSPSPISPPKGSDSRCPSTWRWESPTT